MSWGVLMTFNPFGNGVYVGTWNTIAVQLSMALGDGTDWVAFIMHRMRSLSFIDGLINNHIQRQEEDRCCRTTSFKARTSVSPVSPALKDQIEIHVRVFFTWTFIRDCTSVTISCSHLSMNSRVLKRRSKGSGSMKR